MGAKRHRPEGVVAKLRRVDVLVPQGQGGGDAIRTIAVTEVADHRWRKEYGSLRSDRARRMKDLETENRRLGKAIADLALDKPIPQGAARGNRPAPRRCACIGHVVAVLDVSERRACRALGPHRPAQRKVPRGRDDEAAPIPVS